MGRSSGQAKSGGRQLGTPNRRTTQLIDALDKAGLDPIVELTELIPNMTLGKKVHVLLSLLPYLYPRRKPTDLAPPTLESIALNLFSQSPELLRSEATALQRFTESLLAQSDAVSKVDNFEG